jgi:hypothetical protein
MPLPNKVIVFVTLVIFATGCRSIKPDVPALPAQARDVPQPPPSQIDIPVQVDLNPLYAQIESSVPAKLTSQGYPAWESSDNCLLEFKWNFWREKLTFTAQNNTLNIGCIGYYHGQGQVRPCCWGWCPWVNAGCGSDALPRQLQMGIASTVNIGANYRIISSTKLTKLDGVNRCKVTPLNFDITDAVLKQARTPIENACRDFDNSMLAYNLRTQVEQVWKTLYTPVPVDTFGSLVFNPTTLRISKLTTQGSMLNFSIGATALPQFVFKGNAAPVVPPLPALLQNEQQGGGFAVYLEARLPYAELAKIANTQMQGMRFDYGKRHIEVLEVQLAGTGSHKLMIKVNFKGSAKGWMYLTGTPHFDTATKEITLPDIDFDVKTSNLLLKSAKWLFNGKITTSLKQNAHYNIADMLSTIKTQVEQNLTKTISSGVSTSGVVNTVTISNLYPASDFLQVTTLIQGRLDAKVTAYK